MRVFLSNGSSSNHNTTNTTTNNTTTTAVSTAPTDKSYNSKSNSKSNTGSHHCTNPNPSEVLLVTEDSNSIATATATATATHCHNNTTTHNSNNNNSNCSSERAVEGVAKSTETSSSASSLLEYFDTSSNIRIPFQTSNTTTTTNNNNNHHHTHTHKRSYMELENSARACSLSSSIATMVNEAPNHIYNYSNKRSHNQSNNNSHSDHDHKSKSNSNVSISWCIDPNDNRKKSSASFSSSSSSTIPRSNSNSNLVEDDFRVALKRRGLQIQEVDGDGNCLFRAVALQVYGDASMHYEVRRRCMDFMNGDAEHFSQFIPEECEDFAAYIRRKRRDGVHGNNPEIQAISELYNRPVEVYVPPAYMYRGSRDNDFDPAEEEITRYQNEKNVQMIQPINIFQSEYKTVEIPIRLSYHDGNHYNAIIDPYMPTAGLGLGMPGLKPGLADKMQMQKALLESDNVQLDYLYEKNAIVMSDIEATDYALEQAILASSLQAQERGKPKDENERKPSPIYNHTSPLESDIAVSSASSLAQLHSEDEYPECVQELVMNGFLLEDVLKARDLVGDNFENLLAFLLSRTSNI